MNVYGICKVLSICMNMFANMRQDLLQHSESFMLHTAGVAAMIAGQDCNAEAQGNVGHWQLVALRALKHEMYGSAS